MTVRRLLTTSLLFTVSLFLMAFQGEPTAPATTDMIPGLIWILLLLVGVGLLMLAWGQREVDAFAVPHHDEQGHDDHSHDTHTHDDHQDETHDSLLGVDGTHNTNDLTPVGTEAVATHTAVVAVPPVMPMGQGEPVVPALVEVPDDAPEVADVADIQSVPATATTSADVAIADADDPVLAAVEIPEPTPAPLPMSVPVADDDISPAVVATDANIAVDTPDEAAEEPRNTTSSIGMRERPNFQKVDIPDTLPAAQGAVRDTMEFRMGEDNPGEIVQRPATGETYEPTPMSMGGGGLAPAELDIPDLDVPDLGMPALDAANSEFTEPDTEAVSTIANVSLEAGLYEDTESQDAEPVSTGLPSWFTGEIAPPAPVTPTPTPLAAPVAEWEESTLEPPNTAEGSTVLPVITLPTYDSDLSGAPKWLITGNDDDANDDLLIIEGIGPKIASILNNSGIRSFRRLAGTGVENLREILDKAGISHIADPSTWAEQAQHAADGAMDKLQELQERLKGGRKE
jgi:hypothetical protein